MESAIIKNGEMKIIVFDELDSTQSYLKRQIASNASVNKNEIILAKQQTKGLGRKNSKWISFEGCLTFSFIINDQVDIKIQEKVLLMILRCLEGFGICNVNFKWPNDILVDNYKICGVLFDRINDLWIVGVGINLKGVYNNFHSIESLTGVQIDSYQFIFKFMNLIKRSNETDIGNVNWAGLIKMSEYYIFKNERMKLVSIDCENIVCQDKYEKVYCFNSSEYSLDSKTSEIREK